MTMKNQAFMKSFNFYFQVLILNDSTIITNWYMPDFRVVHSVKAILVLLCSHNIRYKENQTPEKSTTFTWANLAFTRDSEGLRRKNGRMDCSSTA